MKSSRSCSLIVRTLAFLAAAPGWSGYSANLAQTATPLKATVLTLSQFGRAGAGGDDTGVFRRAIAEGSRLQRAIQVPATRLPYRISPLYIPSNTTLLLDAGVTIQALPGFKDGKKLINIEDVQAVQIIGYGAILKMNRTEYADGEYRHCISITGSTRVSIKGVTCRTPGGNGVYVGPGDHKSFSEDVLLEDLSIENSIGSALKIVSVRNLIVRRSRFNAGGRVANSGKESTIDKKSGIEFYPNNPQARLEGVRLEDNETVRSQDDGVRLILSHLAGSSAPVGVSIIRHRDSKPGASSFLGTNDPPGGTPVRGEIQFEECRSEGAQQYGLVFSFWSSIGAHALVRDLTVVDPNGSGSTMDNAAVAVKRGGGGRGPIGNIDFIGTSIIDTRHPSKLDYYFTFADYSHVGIEHVSFRDAGRLSGARPKPSLGLYQGEGLDKIDRPDDPTLLALWQTAAKREGAGNGRTR